jgi:adenosylcobinamide kinase / adenosylcobinamide-phosphate guanylyltransferase
VSPDLTLVTGGVRAGKSAFALELATRHAGQRPVLFVATAQAFDDDMRRRIDAHRRERPATWRTLESPVDVAADLDRQLRDSQAPYGAVVIDCLTLWVSNILLSLEDDADAETIVASHTRGLISVLQSTTTPTVIVTNEVGLGVVPPTLLGRRYRDALGRANQLVAAASTRVSLLIAGVEVPIKPRG